MAELVWLYLKRVRDDGWSIVRRLSRFRADGGSDPGVRGSAEADQQSRTLRAELTPAVPTRSSGLQRLLDGPPDLSGAEGFAQARPINSFQELSSLRAQRIACEEDNAPQ